MARDVFEGTTLMHNSVNCLCDRQQREIKLIAHRHGDNGSRSMSGEGESYREKIELRRMTVLLNNVSDIQGQGLHGPAHDPTATGLVPRQRSLLDDGN
jgi:hypothetical protein